MPHSAIARITHHLTRCDAVSVAWLYGSRATGRHSVNSDYDVAVALQSGMDAKSRQSMVDELSYQLTSALEAASVACPVSVVDINAIPTPLAINVISDGRVLCCRDELRLMAEMQRVWSMWEAYQYEYERFRE